MYTTKRRLRAHGPCVGGWKKFRAAHRGVGDTEPISYLSILDSNGLYDTFWALRVAAPEGERDRFCRLLACDYAEHVLPIWEAAYPEDRRPHEAIAVARRYARGEATAAELEEAASGAQRAASKEQRSPAAAAAATCATARAAEWAVPVAALAASRAAMAAAERSWQEQRLREALTSGWPGAYPGVRVEIENP